MKIKFLGHNCFLINYKGKNILTDPFYNFQKEQSGFEISKQDVDFVLITHAHYDHIADVAEVLEHYSEATIIAQPEICTYFGHTHNIDLNIGGTTKVEDLEITMLQAAHTSSFPDGRYGGVPSSYMLSYEGKNIYLAGDTGMTTDMQWFPKIFGEISLAILPIGGHYTMDAKLASFVATELLKTPKVLACHFDTFPPIAINHEEALKFFEEKGIELILPKLGLELELK